jgi:uncharacterized protein
MFAKPIVADAGPLIALAIGGVLDLTTALFGGLMVPEAVLQECGADPFAPGAAEIAAAHKAGHFEIIAHASLTPFDAALALGLGSGEVAVLAYAHENGLLTLIDERRARRVASRLNVPVIGSGTVLAQLKRSGHIASVKPVLALWQQHGYFVAQTVQRDVVKAAGEQW